MILRYQMGGEVPPAEQAAPAAAGQEEMIAQLQGVADQIVSEMGPEAAMMLAQLIMEMVQGGAELEEEAAVAYDKNGKKLKARKKSKTSKCADGAKMKKCVSGAKMKKC